MRLPITPECIFKYSTIESVQFSPDCSEVVFVRKDTDPESNGYIYTIWKMYTDGRQEPFRFTSGTSDTCPQWSPDGAYLAFISARKGTPQVYVMQNFGGEAVCLTDMVGSVSDLRWSPDGKWLAFVSESTAAEREIEDMGLLYHPTIRRFAGEWIEKERAAIKDPRVITKLPYRTGTEFFDGRYRHIYVMPFNGGTPKRLTNGDFHHSAPVWTPDSKYIITNSCRVQENGDENFELWSTIFRYDISTGKETVLVSEVSEEGRPAYISPNGKWLLHNRVLKPDEIRPQEAPSPYQEPYHVAVSPYKPNAKPVQITDDSLSVNAFRWDADSEHIFYLIEDRGTWKIVRVDRDGKNLEEITDGKLAVSAFDVSPDGKSIAFIASDYTTPCNLYIISTDTKKKKRKPVQLTTFNEEFEKAYYLSEGHTFWYKDADGVDIQGWYFLPRNYDPTKKYPLQVWNHGGPQMSESNKFSFDLQWFTSNGFIVFYCNFRGSAGYGAEFQRMRGKGGEKDMADVMAGVDYMIANVPGVDPNQMVVTGASYGGFLTAWIVTHTDRFKAAISQCGVYDQLNMFGSGDIPESEEWYYGGVPSEETLATYWEQSPAAHAADEHTPLMILHNELDYRVPISQAEMFYAMLRRNGNKDVVLTRFPNEGHLLARLGTPMRRVHRYYLLNDWFKRFVTAPEDEPTKAELTAVMHDLDGWSVDKRRLLRVIPCGTRDIALRVLNKVNELASARGMEPTVLLSETDVAIYLESKENKKVGWTEINFAYWLSFLWF